MEDWRSPTSRSAVIQKLEAVMKESGGTSPNFQNPVEVEKAFFEKSKTKDEYQSYFRNTILHLSRNKAPQTQGMMQPNRGNPAMGTGQHNSMTYGQNFSQYGGGGGMNPGGNQVPNSNFPGGGGGGMGMPNRPQQPPQYPMYAPGANPGSGVHMQQYPGMGMPQSGFSRPSSNYSGPHGMGIGNYPQQGGVMGGSFSQPGMMTGQRPPMSNMMRPGGMMPPPPGMQPPGVVMRPGMPNSMQSSSQHPFVVDNGGQQVHAVPNPYSTGMRPMNPSPAYSSSISSASNTQVSSHPGSFNVSSSTTGMQGSPSVPPTSTSVPPTSGTSAGGTESGQLHQPMPPSMTESTSSANPPTPLMFAGSPAPPTPIYPVSPATGAQGVPSNQPQPSMTPEENEAYMRKLNELQKYIPVMSEWINRLSKDDKKTDQYMKLKSLYNLLQNPGKRIALNTLKKCETALEKMFDKNPDKANPLNSSAPGSVPPLSVSSSSAVPGPPSSSTTTQAPHSDPSVPEPKLSNPQQSQSLLDFKMTRSPPPVYANLSAIIPRTGCPFDRLPAAKRQRLLSHAHRDDSDKDLVLPANVKRELMHLDQFDIKVEHSGDEKNKIILTCSINNECHLPQVPSLTIVLPHEYPAVSPVCDLTHYKEMSSPFIKRVGSVLSETMSKRVGNYTFSSLLDCWMTSLLTAIAETLDMP